MTKRMLIDATHAEETRVVVLDGNRLEDFDVETSTKRQLKGNIYLAKVVRVEPSLQACFVEYGGNRHGFLAFSEIHPDYYQIPVADRQRLIEMEEEEARREEEEADRELEDTTASRAAESASPAIAAAETSDESGGTVETLHEAMPRPAAEVASASASAAPAETAAAAAGETGDESGAVALLPATTAEPPPPAALAAAETGDESGVIAARPAEAGGEPTLATASAALPDDSLGGAAAVIPAGAASEPPAAALLAAPDESIGGAAAGHPAEAAASEPTAAMAEPGDGVPGALAATPFDSAAEPAAAPGPAAEEVTAAEVPPDAAATRAQPPAARATPEDEPEPPPSRRAQPLIIESETISGPAESDGVDEEADTVDTESVRVDILEADTETEHEFAPYHEVIPESPPPETVGGEPDSAEEQREHRIPPRFLRNYKIQEVIRRRQILLVQVVKEERGTKGAALTTYLSLAGRFSVLMPNSPRGGGISRKITSATDRRRLKEIITELDMPKGMGLIVRTAGANRPKPEIKRDCEYLLRLWDDIREHTLKSVAPALIYEEASLIKRAIRDVYSRDIDEIQVDGEDGWRAAHEFMRMLMPTHAKKVQLWRDPSQPLFARYQVEAQLDAMLQPTVQLRSGGYLVINQAEALVAIDVNSGRATRERNVEEMALRTNLEAADEVARQLRLRDLAGLVVIDFIDMESKKHNAMVERRIKEALKNDRARIQVGHISHFGLLEMSRQRLRPSLAETSFILCPHCGGTGHVRSTESAAIHVLRGIEEEGSKRRSAEIVVHVATPTALYILNHKRDRLREIELRYAMRVTVLGDDTQVASQFRIDRVRQQTAHEGLPAAITPDMPQPSPLPPPTPEVEEAEEAIVTEVEARIEEPPEEEETGAEAIGEEGEAKDKGEPGDRHRRRRRRRRGRREEGAAAAVGEEPALLTEMPTDDSPFGPEPVDAEAEAVPVSEEAVAPPHIEGVPEHAEPTAEDDGRRRRGRRGGRRRRRDGEGEGSPFAAPGAEQPELPPVYLGPTPANPFGGHAFDIFDVLEQAEANAAATRRGPAEPMMQQFEPSPDSAAGAFGPREAVAAASDETQPAVTPVAEAAPEPMPAAEEGRAAEPASATEAGRVTELAPEPKTAPERAEAELPGLAGHEAPATPSIAADDGPALEPQRAGADATPEIINAAAPEPALNEPVAEAGATASSVAETATAAAAEAANDLASEPAIRPILVGSEAEPPAEKKRGWWRR